MKIAISNIAWGLDQDEIVYQWMKEAGFFGLEIAPSRVFGNQPYDDLVKSQAWKRELATQWGLSVISMQSIWYGRSEGIFTSLEEREKLLSHTEKAIAFAEAINCKHLVFGCPKNRILQKESDKEIATHFFRDLAIMAEKQNCVIGLEANPTIYGTNFINRTEEAFRFVKEINSDGLKVNLDLGTMIANEEPASVIKHNVQWISHVHISEPALALVKRRMIHQEVLQLLFNENYNGYISIEMKRQNEINDIYECLKYLQALIGEFI